MSRSKKEDKKLTVKQIVVAMAQVAVTTFRASPIAIVVQVAGSIMTALLPLITTYFAALTTTSLAEAYMGNEQARERVIVYVLVTALLGVAMTIWSSVESYVRQLTRYKVEAAITDRMYEQFHQIDFWRYDDKDTADMYDRATKFARFFPYVFDQLASLLTNAITAIVGVVLLAAVSWWLGAIVVAAIVPGIVIQLRLSRVQARHWNENVETRRSQRLIEWNILQPQHIAEIRLYGVVRKLLDLRMQLREKDEKIRIEFERKFLSWRLGGDMLEAGAEVAALVWVVVQIIDRAQPVGQFLYVQQIVSRAIGGANSFVSTVSSIDEDLANLYDYQAFMSLPTREGAMRKIEELPQTISVSDISFCYPGSHKKVLDQVSMTIKAGSRVAIVGENGAGKSTLVKLLTGLYAPTEGAILLDGVDIAAIDIESWHRYIGVLQQDFVEYDFATAKESILLGDVAQEYTQERLDRAIESAQARTFLASLPKGADSYVHPWMEGDDGAKGQMLSGGQKQRLALARNFYRDSPVVILDEPTSAIDALAESRIFEHLFSQSDKTLIIISHRLTTVEKADNIYMLEHGKIVEQGTHAELVAQKGAYYRMFKSQLRK